mmetsp:Transcript_25964/g.54166  ORF Transcript_25964/g.54166 Transcript_25964/m.54166 type:complete len:142 (+) Transcript_25964:69-494(+)
MKNFVLILLSVVVATTTGFVVPSTSSSRASALFESKNPLDGFMNGVSKFFAELDAFVDDASARRLGNGAAFYGKRKSSFYGSEDKNKKADRDVPDPTEDYQGPTNTGMFVWIQDEETGQMKPATRMKKKVIERNPKFWDRV